MHNDAPLVDPKNSPPPFPNLCKTLQNTVGSSMILPRIGRGEVVVQREVHSIRATVHNVGTGGRARRRFTINSDEIVKRAYSKSRAGRPNGILRGVYCEGCLDVACQESATMQEFASSLFFVGRGPQGREGKGGVKPSRGFWAQR